MPPSTPGSSRAFLLTLLFIASLLLGVLCAWGVKQRGERLALSRRNSELENAYVAVLATRNDLATLLTDPRTKLFNLGGRGEAAGRSVTVAWREATHSGALIGDGMPLPPDDAKYTLWLLDANHAATNCGSFRPDSAGTIYPFRVLGPDVEGAGGFRVSVERDAAPKSPGAALYETQ